MGLAPPQWTEDQLERDRQAAIELFRQERFREPLEQYLEAFDRYRRAFEDLLMTTGDLGRLHETALQVLTDERLREALRYLAGPVVSADDLKTLSGTTFSRRRLSQEPAVVSEIVEIILLALDRRRFPWVSEERQATREERDVAILASAALAADRRVGTRRRNEGKSKQEEVRQTLEAAGLSQVGRRAIGTLILAPQPGEFCLESMLGTRKADLIVMLWDHRLMPIECKVSNSAVNSVKRLNNDAAAKAEAWTRDFGRLQVVPVAVLSGVYKLHNLQEAQARGLALFWAHNLDALVDWIALTRQT